jgi:hypothetical protein
VTDHAALLAALEKTAGDLPDGIEVTDADGSRTWTSGGASFAVLRGSVVDLRVGAAIGAAALRTPDVTTSATGSDWVAFAPLELDGHALDRLGAWFAAAHRRAVA